MLFTPSPCHKLSHLLGPPAPSSVTYFMDGPFIVFCNCRPDILSIIISTSGDSSRSGRANRGCRCGGEDASAVGGALNGEDRSRIMTGTHVQSSLKSFFIKTHAGRCSCSIAYAATKCHTAFNHGLYDCDCFHGWLLHGLQTSPPMNTHIAQTMGYDGAHQHRTQHIYSPISPTVTHPRHLRWF